MKRSKKTDPGLLSLIDELKRVSRENEAPIWRDIAKRLEKPSRVWSEVNVSRISRYVRKNETIIVPGKLLGAGEIDFPITVAAYRTTGQAREKISNAGGKLLSIEELARANPRGKGIRIIG